jgi:tetratricopeptide (TPR) repeat protein
VAELDAPYRPSKWIISPAADLALLVATPLAIVPLVAIAGRQISAEVIFLYVAAFASIGHHLPGYLRAYGDRELFARFRWRFLLAPPIALAVAVSFTWSGLHGLELLLLGWATWHILMQTYGFVRIYDMKSGAATAASAWIDFLLCASIFAAGIIFSQSRLLGIVETLMLAGLPVPNPTILTYAQWFVGGAAVLMLVVSIAQAIGQSARGAGNPVKWLLVLSTAWLYWVCGSLTTNLLVGVAMFEIFHALQYYAIVWSFNRRRARLARNQLGPLAALFGDAWWCLWCYIAAIAAFGSLRLLSAGLLESTTQNLLLALLAASTMLHFYYDGFIWKVREPATQVNLGIDQHAAAARSNFPLAHPLRWALLLIGVATFYGLEQSGYFLGDADDDRRRLALLADWSPEVPELQLRLSAAALADGDAARAVEQARRAVAAQPRSHAAHGALGTALLRSGHYEESAIHLRQAIALGSPQWENHLDLGQALAHLGALDEAEQAFVTADRMHPRCGRVHVAWGDALARGANPTQSLVKYRLALAFDSETPEVRAAVAQALSAAGQHREAIAAARNGAAASPQSAAAQLVLGDAYFASANYSAARRAFAAAVDLAPEWAEARYRLGATQLQRGEFAAAQESLQQAVRLQNDHGLACFQLANVYLLSGQLPRAAATYRRCSELLPVFPDAHNNRGAVLFELGDLSAAAEAYRSALRLAPDRPDSHYNLALVLLRQGERDAARVHVQRAIELGLAPSAEVAAAIAE